jgi:hypothetical protein
MHLADYHPDEVANWMERLEKDRDLALKTLEKALDDVPIIEYWVRAHLEGRKNGGPEELLMRVNDIVNLLLALYAVERQHKH